MPDMRISEDTILLVARLVNEAEDMKDAANEALKDTWADHREALKSLGLTGKEISFEIAQFKAAISDSRMSATEADKREQKAEGKDEYLAILTSSRARARERLSNTAQNTSNSGPDDEETQPEVTTPQTRIAALRADPALAIVEPAILESKLQKVQTAQTEPQPSPKAGSDLTVPPSPQGQVAQIPAAVEAQRSTPVDDVGGSGEANQPETANETTAARTDVRDNSKGPDQSALPANPVAATTPPAGTQAPPVDTIAGSSNGRTAAFDAVNAGSTTAPASKYADPGVVVWESFPPEGVVQSEYSKAFGTLGQDMAVIEDDLSRLSAAPIQKIGNVILDGWARYNKARGMATEVLEDGVTKRIPVEYQVVQYDGSDPLLDCIHWNVGGRILSNTQKQTVVNRLIAVEPKRKAEIVKAMAEMAI